MRSTSRIIILTPGFPANEGDSVTIPSLQMFLRALSRNSPAIQVTVISFQYPFKRGSYHWHGIPVWSAGGRNGKLNRLLTWLRVILKLAGINKREGIAVIHAFWLTETSLIGVLVARLFRIPFLATAMGRDVLQSNHYLPFLRMFRFRLVLLSRFQERFPGKRIREMVKAVIPFGVETSYFHPSETTRDIDVLGVGSLSETKNYPEFTRVIDGLVQEFPGLRCTIIGADTGNGNIRRSIEQSPAIQHITLMGELPYNEVIAVMKRSRILLHCAPFEGQGLVITEALAAGMKVVCRPAGIAFQLESDSIVTASKTSSLAESIKTILQKTDTGPIPVIPYTIDDTCAGYHEFYRYTNDIAS